MPDKIVYVDRYIERPADVPPGSGASPHPSLIFVHSSIISDTRLRVGPRLEHLFSSWDLHPIIGLKGVGRRHLCHHTLGRDRPRVRAQTASVGECFVDPNSILISIYTLLQEAKPGPVLVWHRVRLHCLLAWYFGVRLRDLCRRVYPAILNPNQKSQPSRRQIPAREFPAKRLSEPFPSRSGGGPVTKSGNPPESLLLLLHYYSPA